MIGNGANPVHLASINDTATFGKNAQLWGITINTGAASAVVTVYNGTATTDPVVATVVGTAAFTANYWGARFPNGLFVKLTGGAADVTVVAG